MAWQEIMMEWQAGSRWLKVCFGVFQWQMFNRLSAVNR
jgi:hypothetical protein